MELNKETYSKQEVEEMLKPLNKEINDLKGIVTEGNKAIEKVKELEKTNLDTAIKLEVTKAGLDPDDTFDLVSADTLEKAQEKIKKLYEMQKKLEIDSGYKPDNHKQNNDYEQAEKAGNIEQMIGSKLSKFFGK